MADYECDHGAVETIALDQTVGIRCLECGKHVAVCWYDEHIPQTLWNKACLNDPGAIPCEDPKENFCALCDEKIV